MSPRWLLSLLCLALLFLTLVQLTHAGGELRVDEAGTSISFEKGPAEVLLALENPSAGNVNANVELELLDPRDKRIATSAQVQPIASGRQKLRLSLPFTFSTSDATERNRILLYRLHYRLSSQASPAETLADGIISLSEITPEFFDLRASAMQPLREGNQYRVRVLAAHPVTQRPAPNVRVEAQVTLDADDKNLVKLSGGSRITDSKGHALFDFELPSHSPESRRNVRSSGGELHVTGRRGAIVVQTKGEVLVDQFVRVLISTDKPLYQPGQVVHMRALAFTPSKQALAHQETYFKICDPEGTVLYRTVATTSRFGIASTDWTIPENTRLGDYRISVGVDGGEDLAAQDVRISRYELPNFTVNVELDRKFYLPGQNATATVRANYLLGQPVLRGKVRVVRESDRSWNYREQKWELDEDAEQKGETNADGSFVVNLDLSSDHEDLSDDYDDERFEDITYAAYFTDPTTNRTEQRRFDVRVTRDPIHVYVVDTYDWSYSRELPIKFYVSTFYADGSPARCKVNVTFSEEYRDTTKRVATVATNRYGLAQISTRLPKEFENSDKIEALLSVSDSKGRKGSGSETFRFEDDPRLRVETDKTIYFPGQPINAVITASEYEGPLVVDLSTEAGSIVSKRVQLRNGRASIAFPFRSEFKNNVSVVAYPQNPKSRSLFATRTVLYPHNSELNIDVQSSQDTYRPGEDAQLKLHVRSAEDRSQESALGVVVLDQAVVERFRTDQEFGGRAFDPENAIQRFLGMEDQLAGVSMRDLQRLDTSRAVSPDLDLLAAVLLRNTTNHFPEVYSSDELELNAAAVYGESMREQLKPVKKALSDHYAATMEYPEDEAELHNSLSQLQIDFNSVRDPWGMPYRAEFSLFQQNDRLALYSSGADKRYATDDDFVVDQMSWPYFRSVGETIDRAVTRYHHRTGKFIRDTATLRDEVSTDGLHLDHLYDRWGKPYRLDFEVQESDLVLQVRSGGPDRHFSKQPYLEDDFIIWKSTIDYFARPRAQISAALTENLERTKTFPQSDQELRQALRGLGDSFENLRDPWGRPYYHTFRIQSIYTDRVRLESRAIFGETPMMKTPAMHTNITPVTQTLGLIRLRSVGPDAKAGTSDDFTVATFSGVITEQPRGAAAPVAFTSGVVFSGVNGAVVGVVTDPVDSVVSGVTVTATRSPGGPTYETSTNENGKYSFSLVPGLYDFTFQAPGFNRIVIGHVLVRSQNVVELNATLNVGHVAESVSISAAESPMTTDLSINAASRTVRDRTKVITKTGSQQMSTPRLREYFPETLLWQPSIETDKHGRAEINFKLADNITTWKMVVIGSTEDGRIGTIEKDIKAFQPFFVEHDPPRVLTDGDEISLPIVVRNYLSQAQKVDLEIKPESWFSLLGPAQKQTNVAAGDAVRETFDFRVLTSVKDGKQRITARGSDESDAIEKPVTVHPDGEELSVTAGEVLDDRTPLELEIAPSMISESSRGELKIYPNLLAHVVEGVEAIMKRPYGCGEQTISSTYPSLLLLRHYKKRGESFPLRARAQRYLDDGYSRLLNYRAESGGFTYWGQGDPDVALTAYAVRFLVDAGDFTSVDQGVIKQAREWLVKQQRPDGSWRNLVWGDRPEGQRASVVLTAYVTRILTQIDPEVSDATKRALDFLARESQRIDEPYLLASYALAAMDTKDMNRAKPALETLRSLALEEGDTSYWSLETNTPFYGWGIAGRIETTALVVQALAKNCNSQTADCEADRKLIHRGLLFLLEHKDRYGVWHSTQATINVLDLMLLLFSNSAASAGSQSSADIVINGNRVQTLQFNDRFNNPMTVDISQFLTVGKNKIEIRRPKGFPLASVQAVANYYVPWSVSPVVNSRSKSDLRLQVKFDKTDAKINDEITCRVEATRVGFQGYGMMLAEIGIPPGAEVDRSSLETALTDWAINRYDVLPDRVVVYLWPRSGGVSFNFKFRPRFGLKAKTAASTLYDYYNPEAAVVLAPSVFTVR